MTLTCPLRELISQQSPENGFAQNTSWFVTDSMRSLDDDDSNFSIAKAMVISLHTNYYLQWAEDGSGFCLESGRSDWTPSSADVEGLIQVVRQMQSENSLAGSDIALGAVGWFLDNEFSKWAELSMLAENFCCAEEYDDATDRYVSSLCVVFSSCPGLIGSSSDGSSVVLTFERRGPFTSNSPFMFAQCSH